MFAATNSSGGSPISLLFFIAIPVALYFLMIRPQKKRMAAQQALGKNIAEGDEVMTTSGVYGFVTAIEDDIVWLEIAEGVDIRITKSAVAKKVTSVDAAEPTDAEPSTDAAK